ncbi:cupin domain-containing protein [candidate division KSB1 bacterium]|nr:cupin domain-containing protein [candidate division KSB1 bacterium]
MRSKVTIPSAFAQITEFESPQVVAEVNEFQVKCVKLKGPFVWHFHAEEDELFYVVKGQLKMQFRDGDVILNPGELIVVPHGVEHCPVADVETHIILFERNTTKRTGNLANN